MESDDEAAGGVAHETARPRSYLFTVRLWKQPGAGGSEYRGSVREVLSGANRHFRDWSELTSFMMTQVEEDENPSTEATEGGA